MPTEWQTGVVVPIFKKGDWGVCSSYRGISLPRKVFSEALEKQLRLRVERQIQEQQCGFCHSCETVVQLFTFSCLLGAPWDFAIQVSVCFVNLEKVYDWVSWGVL